MCHIEIVCCSHKDHKYLLHWGCRRDELIHEIQEELAQMGQNVLTESLVGENRNPVLCFDNSVKRYQRETNSQP